MEPRDSRQGKIALIFARALVAKEYSAAHEMLASALREKLSPTELKQAYERMIAYGNGPPDFVDVLIILDDWPAKQKVDIGWAYVAINGDGYAEAVSMVVTQEAGRDAIRGIEWGRP